MANWSVVGLRCHQHLDVVLHMDQRGGGNDTERALVGSFALSERDK